jgi:hypothetical protein
MHTYMHKHTCLHAYNHATKCAYTNISFATGGAVSRRVTGYKISIETERAREREREKETERERDRETERERERERERNRERVVNGF